MGLKDLYPKTQQLKRRLTMLNPRATEDKVTIAGAGKHESGFERPADVPTEQWTLFWNGLRKIMERKK